MSVRVRLSPQEATVVAAAAARAGVSVGAWVGETALRSARGAAEPERVMSSTELLATLVALRAEAAAHLAVGDGNAADGSVDRGLEGERDVGLVRVLQRIDAVTAAVLPAAVRSRGRGAGPGSGSL